MKSPLITMSAITGKPTRQEIFEYMKGLKDNGIDQAMLYPRSGCGLDYLENEWFETVKHYIDAAKENDMYIWIYDDFNWPSGDAHGRVSKVPEYRLKAVCTKGEKMGEIDCYSKNKGSIFGETYFPDLLGDKAMDYFIECTHEKYYEYFGEYFGNLIRGFFTDEPGVGYCCTDESMPYYDGMADDYKAVSGRDFYEDMKNSHEDFYGISLKLVGEQYRKCFVGKLAKWCREHNVALTGHLMEDTTPHGATKQCGDILKALRTFNVPGIDELRTNFKDLCILNLLGTVQYGKKDEGAMAELFALGPCDISFANKKSIIYLCSCFGINKYFLAISHFDMRGNMNITDYFNNFNTDVPDFKSTRLLSEEAKKTSELAKKDFTPKIYIRYPTEICAKHLHDELNLMRFFKLVNTLTYNQIQWKYADNTDNFTDAPTLEFTQELEYVLDGNKITLEEILEKFRVTPVVTNLNGKTEEGIFVRKYDDGTTVVLNLYAEKGNYLINGKKEFLDDNAVLVFDTDVEEYTEHETTPCNAEFSVKYCNENMIRTMYVNDATKAEIHTECDMNVTFAVRDGVTAKLFGKELECNTSESEKLSFGFRKLYNLSDLVKLEKGITVVESEKDVKYLPSVFIIGDFSCENVGGEVSKAFLVPRKNTNVPGDELYDYGRVELEATVTVPENASAIELEGASLFTQLYINGRLCGEKACSPYVFELDDECKGKQVKLKLVQYSSIGSVFGDVEYFTEHSTTTNWKTPSPKRAKYGFDHLLFHAF